ncbi:MAG: ice-binding family protein [Gemmatimonadaceae bacterium]
MRHLARPSASRRRSRGVGAILLLAVLGVACSDSGTITGASVVMSKGASLTQSHDFTVLANAAVTCTDGSITGDVGTFQAPPTGSFTQTNCPVSGSIHIGDAEAIAAYNAFLATYDALTPEPGDSCTLLTGTLAGVTLAPGTYCFDAAAALTGTLTLDGSSSAKWLFLVGTSGTGALTGTNFNVVLANGADACNITWWVAEAATMTTSNFAGSILAGAGITLGGGTSSGNVWSKLDVTITGTKTTGCQTTSSPGPGPGPSPDKERCDQGVGNGPEGCDPGKSNKRLGSNDELGGTPGNPGRKGGGR